jgi:sugar fermentation stimulation protein A
MKFSQPLLQGRLLKRYKRFFADVEIAGEVVVAHVANTGSLRSCLFEGQACRVSRATNPERKLQFSLEMVQTPAGHWVGVNTAWPNLLAAEAFAQKVLPWWREYDQLVPECKISDETRLDMVLIPAGGLAQYSSRGSLTSARGKTKPPPPAQIIRELLQNPVVTPQPLHFVEIKNVTLREGDLAQFPDAETVRGQKHLRELIKLIDLGHTAEIVFVVQRGDCGGFAPAHHIDPQYADLLHQAIEHGVRLSPIVCEVGEHEILLTMQRLNWDLSPACRLRPNEGAKPFLLATAVAD